MTGSCNLNLETKHTLALKESGSSAVLIARVARGIEAHQGNPEELWTWLRYCVDHEDPGESVRGIKRVLEKVISSV